MFRRNALCVLAGLLQLAALYAHEPRPAPQTPIPLPGGKKIRLQQYRGQVVVLAIFSLTCPDCIENVQMLNRVQKDTGALGFQAIGAAGNDNAAYEVGGFIERYKIAFPIGYLNKDEMIAIGDIEKNRRPVAPIFLFIDKTGVVRFQYYGDDPFFKTAERSTRLIVQELLKQKAK